MSIRFGLRLRWRALALFLGALILAGLAARPLALRWGATDRDLARTWPGDELLDRVDTAVTRAVTVHAAPEAVWPWLMQIGHDRGGFYSYSRLENLFGLEMKNVYRVVPEFQKRAVGDTVWFGPRNKFGGNARMVVGELIPNRAMVFVMPDDWVLLQHGRRATYGLWGFILDPVDAHTTRLVMRSVGGGGRSWQAKLMNYVLVEPAHFIMERKMMLTLRDLAENTHV